LHEIDPEMINLIDNLREISVRHILKTVSVQNAWRLWKSIISKSIGNPPTATSVLDLGDNLKKVFKSTSKSGRSQGTLKGGGVSWEGLVVIYLNLCLLGSRVVIVNMNKKMVPEPIRDSITVQYGSFASNSESDLLAITFPKRKEYTDKIKQEDESPDGMKKLMDTLVGQHFEEFEVGIIQCKTNWNDNAQIPMLWDMVYQAKGFGDRNISVGKNNYDINSLKKFTYSFVTVPTQNSKFKKNTAPVNRVYNISGGNYWGLPSESGICNSLKEIFNKNFSGGTNQSLRTDLSKELSKLNSKYRYFDLG